MYANAAATHCNRSGARNCSRGTDIHRHSTDRHHCDSQPAGSWIGRGALERGGVRCSASTAYRLLTSSSGGSADGGAGGAGGSGCGAGGNDCGCGYGARGMGRAEPAAAEAAEAAEAAPERTTSRRRKSWRRRLSPFGGGCSSRSRRPRRAWQRRPAPAGRATRTAPGGASSGVRSPRRRPATGDAVQHNAQRRLRLCRGSDTAGARTLSVRVARSYPTNRYRACRSKTSCRSG